MWSKLRKQGRGTLPLGDIFSALKRPIEVVGKNCSASATFSAEKLLKELESSKMKDGRNRVLLRRRSSALENKGVYRYISDCLAYYVEIWVSYQDERFNSRNTVQQQ